MKFFNWELKVNKRSTSDSDDDEDEVNFLVALGASDVIDKRQALNVPAFSGCINIIADTIANLPCKLYKKSKGKVNEVSDARVGLLNVDTKNQLSGYDLKYGMIRDWLIDGRAFAYIDKSLNNYNAICYVDANKVSVIKAPDPIYKGFYINVQGRRYEPFEFIKIVKNTSDGCTGIGILQQNQELLKMMYNAMVLEGNTYINGGTKKGFLSTEKQMQKDALANLKAGWQKLTTNKENAAVVLQNGFRFENVGQTFTELMIDSNKKTNAEMMCQLFNIPPALLEGDAIDESTYKHFIKITILPILKCLEDALNRDLLKENEKGRYFFQFDTSELLKADLKDRLSAYGIALNNGVMTINEVREKEKLEAISGMNVLKFSIGNSIYDIDSGNYYNPNTNTDTGEILKEEPKKKGGKKNGNEN